MMHLLIIEETLGAEVIKWVFGILLVLGILAVIAYPIVGMVYGNRKWLQQIYGENWKEKKKEYWKNYGRAKFIAEEKGADGCHHREGDQRQAESKSQGGTCQSGQAD